MSIPINFEDRPWLSQYPKNIPSQIDTEQFETLKDLIEHALQKHHNKPAFSCMGKELSFAEIDHLSSAFGAYLHHKGLKVGDRIALMMPNLLQYPIALFGAIKAGIVIVNTNPLYTPREMKHQFTDSGATAIVIAEPFIANLEQIIADTDIKLVIATSLGEMLSFPKKQIVNFVVRNVKRMVPKHNLEGIVQFSQALKEGKKHSIPQFQIEPEDTVALQYTGGTTGVSKGAMLSHRNLAANTVQSHSWFGPFMGNTSGAMLCPLPLYHIFALTVNCLSMMHHGAKSILITNPRDLSTIVDAFKKNNIGGITGVNTLFNALINDPDFQKLDFKNLGLTVGGGTAVQKPVAKAWEELTACPLSEGYGLTETSPSAIMNPLDGRYRLGHIGLPLPNTDVRIWIEDEQRNAKADEAGEIQIKGPQVMKGYYNKPEETANTFTEDGWLCTGDIGAMTADGFFKVVDRKKDMILVSGFNVFPNEIEDVLASHPKILEVAAIGVPSERSGEAVKVFVVKNDPSLTEEEVISFARESLTAYKVPKLVAFKDELPKSNVGKILRRHLRD